MNELTKWMNNEMQWMWDFCRTVADIYRVCFSGWGAGKRKQLDDASKKWLENLCCTEGQGGWPLWDIQVGEMNQCFNGSWSYVKICRWKPQEVAHPLWVKLVINRIKCTFCTIPLGCSQQSPLSSCNFLYLMQDRACHNCVHGSWFLVSWLTQTAQNFRETQLLMQTYMKDGFCFQGQQGSLLRFTISANSSNCILAFKNLNAFFPSFKTVQKKPKNVLVIELVSNPKKISQKTEARNIIFSNFDPSQVVHVSVDPRIREQEFGNLQGLEPSPRCNS